MICRFKAKYKSKLLTDSNLLRSFQRFRIFEMDIFFLYPKTAPSNMKVREFQSEILKHIIKVHRMLIQQA